MIEFLSRQLVPLDISDAALKDTVPIVPLHIALKSPVPLDRALKDSVLLVMLDGPLQDGSVPLEAPQG
jgi:hypothetical protein